MASLVAAKCAAANILTHAADVSSAEGMMGAAAATAAKFGGLDALVNSAGISLPKEFEATTAQEFENVLRVNVVGTRNAVAAALPHLKKSGNGRIVLVCAHSVVCVLVRAGVCGRVCA